jgi:hypothetical protein
MWQGEHSEHFPYCFGIPHKIETNTLHDNEEQREDVGVSKRNKEP